MGYGRLNLSTPGRGRLVAGLRFAVYGLQFTVCSLRFAVYGLQFTVYGLRFARHRDTSRSINFQSRIFFNAEIKIKSSPSIAIILIASKNFKVFASDISTDQTSLICS
jgi:hypothetical protein